jgi:hypothetical protein
MSYIVILMSFTAIFPSIGYAQSNITNIIYSPEYITPTQKKNQYTYDSTKII